MRKPLGQKPVIINTHPLLEQRLQGARNHYTQCPSVYKRKTCKNWPRLAADEESIRTRPEWRAAWLAGTALRICDDLVAVDADVSSQVVADEIREMIRSLAPYLFDEAIMRTSGGVSFAMFWRWLTPFAHFKTLHYTAHPEVLAELIEARKLPDSVERDQLLAELAVRLEPQHFEIYGSAAKGRYFQFTGPHSDTPEGVRHYKCGERAPWNTPREDLPILPIPPGELVARVEEILAKHLHVIPEEPLPDGEVFYDLDPEMVFVLRDGSHEKLVDLHEQLEWGAEHGVYGCMSDAAWAQSKSKQNAKAYVTTRGRLAVKDWSHDGVMHYLQSEAPPPPVELDAYTIDILKGLMQTTEPPAEPAAPDVEIERSGTPEEVHDSAMGWCTRNLAWFPQAFNGRGGVVSIYPDGVYQKPITLPSLRSTMASCVYTSTGPGGGQRKHNPADSWMARPERVDIVGVRMRPELTRPLFREEGALYVNRYRPPAHPAAGGSTAEFERFMERLVPDLDEREWVWNWLTAKMQHPEWRMVALAMVAEAMGTGRGLLSEILGKLFGDQFVVPIPYSKMAGGGGSNFNSEVENRLIVCVNESHNAEDKKYRNRNAAGEALKVFVEPNHELPFRVEPKGVDAYYTRSAVSTLVFTNHIDGLPIGEGDRRAAVVTNGEQMTVDERQRLRAWKDRPENIGALARLLGRRQVPADHAVFDPYNAPRFRGQLLMIEAGKSSIDLAWDEAARAIWQAADLVTMSQAVKILRHHMGAAHVDEEVLKRHVSLNAKRIGVPNGRLWQPSYGGRRERVFAGSVADAKRYTAGSEQAVLKELNTAQKLADEPERVLNKRLGIVAGVKNE